MSQISKYIKLIEDFILTVLTIASILIAAIAVFFRYVLDQALAWPEEMTGLFLVAIAIVGGSVGVREKLHAQITVFLSFLKPNQLRRLDAVVWLITLVVMIIVFFLSAKFVYELYGTQQCTASIESLPLWIPFIILPVGAAMMTFRCIELLIKLIKQGEIKKDS